MSTIGRDDPCTCGSGKKYKRCCKGKSPREDVVYIGFREPFYGVKIGKDNSVHVRLESGEEVKADYVFSQIQYTKKSGKDKVISSVSDDAIYDGDVHSYLASRFDVMCAIDTNTKQINNEAVSVASIFDCRLKMLSPVEVDFKYRKLPNILFKNCANGEAEKFAWSTLVNMITSSPTYKKNLRFAIVTDHDLTRHTEYNARQLPIYKDFYLPENVKLIYASSDAGKQNVLNFILIECDKDAGQVLRQLAEKGTATVDEMTVRLHQIPNHAALK